MISKLRQKLPFELKKVLPIAVVVVLVGIVVVTMAFAAGPFAASESENGTLSGAAKIVSLLSASGGKVVQFGTGATPTPSSTPAPTPTPVITGAGANLGSTGVPLGLALTNSGNITTTANNQVIDAKNVTGTIVVEDTGVVIKRTKITCNGGYYGIQVMPGASATISDVTIVGDCTGAGITGTDWTAMRVDIYGMTNDGVNMGHRTHLSDSWIHDFHSAVGAHSDGIQGIDTPHDITITNNLVDIGMDGTNSALIITPWTVAESGPVSMKMDHNTWGGGGYVFHLDTGFTAGLSVTNSVFLKDYNFGPIQDMDGTQKIPQPGVWAGNVNASGGLQAW